MGARRRKFKTLNNEEKEIKKIMISTEEQRRETSKKQRHGTPKEQRHEMSKLLRHETSKEE